MSKRDFGTVVQLSSGRWKVRYRSIDGRRVGARQTFTTKKEATLWLDSLRSGRVSGLQYDPVAGEVKLCDYARQWLQDRAGIAPRTREIYESQLKLHILPMIDASVPALSSTNLADLTPRLIRAWFSALKDHKSESTAAKCYVRLRQILNQAVNDDCIVKNPCRIERGGVEHHREQRFATIEELYRIANAVPERYRVLVLTAGLGGLRQGELYALRRSDLDLLHNKISVKRKRVRLASGKVLEDRPKSQAGVRTVSMPKALSKELEVHCSRYAQSGASGLVFTSPDGLGMERSNFRYRVWVPTVERLGLEGLRFHDLRHTAGTLAARTGATTKELMARLGHASHQAAMAYQHAAADRDEQIAEGLDKMVDDAEIADMHRPWQSRHAEGRQS